MKSSSLSEYPTRQWGWRCCPRTARTSLSQQNIRYFQCKIQHWTAALVYITMWYTSVRNVRVIQTHLSSRSTCKIHHFKYKTPRFLIQSSSFFKIQNSKFKIQNSKSIIFTHSSGPASAFTIRARTAHIGVGSPHDQRCDISAAKFIIFNAQFLVLNTNSLVFNTQFISFTHPAAPALEREVPVTLVMWL